MKQKRRNVIISLILTLTLVLTSFVEFLPVNAGDTTTQEIDFPITKYGVYLNDNTGNLDLYLDTSDAISGNGAVSGLIYVDDQEITVTNGWKTTDKGQFSISISKADAQKIEIKPDSMFTYTYNSNTIALCIGDGLKLEKVDGVWVRIIDFPITKYGVYPNSTSGNLDIYLYTSDDTILGNGTVSGLIYADDQEITVTNGWKTTGKGQFSISISKADAQKIEIKPGSMFTYTYNTNKIAFFMGDGLKLEKVDGEWVRRAVEQDIQIDFAVTSYAVLDKEDSWELALNSDKKLLDGYVGKSFQGNVSIDGIESTVNWIVDDIADGSKIHTNDIPKDATTIEVKSGSIFTYDMSSGEVRLKIADALKLTRVDGQWTEDESIDFSISSYSAYEKEDFWQLIVNSSLDVLDDYAYQYFKGNVYINGEEQEISWQILKTDTGSKMHTVDIPKNVESIEIKAGSVFSYSINNNKDIKLNITNELQLVRYEDKLVSEDKLDFPISAYSAYEKEDFWQLIMNSGSDVLDDYSYQYFKGNVYINGEEQEISWQVLKTDAGSKMHTVDIPKNAESVEIKAGSIFTYMTGNKVAKLIITDGLKLFQFEGQLVTGDKVGYTEVTPKFELLESDRLQFRSDIVLGNGKAPDAPYKEWMDFTGKIYIDGKEETIYYTVASSQLFVYFDNRNSNIDVKNASKIQIKAGTVLSSGGVKPIKINNEINLVKDSGKWFSVTDINQGIKYNMIKINYSKFDGRGFYYDAVIISGPDQGKVVADVYGDWASSEGKLIFNGKEILGVYSTASSYIYAAGNYSGETLSSFKIKADTVLIPSAKAKSQVPMKIVNEVDLVKDNKYNRWVLNDGSIYIEPKFNDVKITRVVATGKTLQMMVTLVSDSNKSISEIYGDWKSAVGSVKMADSENDIYTKEGVNYYIAGSRFYINEIMPGLKDEIVIPAGTILWPGSKADSSNPIRIVNEVRMTRDANDDWAITISGKITGSSGLAPQTGDTNPAPVILFLIMVEALVVSVYAFEKKRKTVPQ